MGKLVVKKPILYLPVSQQFKITQPFWFDNTNHLVRHNFYTLFDNHHPGVDFEMPIGTSVLSAFNGVVVRKEFHKGMGNVIGVRNGNIVALYAHLDGFVVGLGDIVKTHELIGLSGNTGVAKDTYPHMHFELRDITKPKLEEMVFEPKFDQPVKQWKAQFAYVVNNKNTSKTLVFLSLRYFGKENRWMRILEANSDLKDFEKDKIIPDNSKVVIPNFSF